MNSDWRSSKSSSKVEPRRLHDPEEGSGVLLQITELEDFVVAIFSWGSLLFPSELEGKLRGLIGKRITTLRLDGCYYIREILEQQ
jgi:hypothetical protein